jgi:hypothetical protein
MSEQLAGRRMASRAGSQGALAATATVGGIAALIGLTAGLAVAGNGSLGAAISPVLLAALLYVIWKTPLRLTLFALMFCMLTLEDPHADLAGGHFKSPLAPISAYLLGNLNSATGVEALHFSGLDCLTLCLVFLVLYRRATGSRIDRRDQVDTSSPMGILGWVAFLSIAGFWVYGMVRGGDWNLSESLWQVQRLAYLPIVFFLFQAALRGPPDYGSLSQVLITAAVMRGAAAILIKTYVRPPDGELLLVATTHEDSLLFVSAFAVLVAGLSERPSNKRVLLCLAVLPLLIWAMVSNNRRLVWVELAAVIIVFFVFSPRSELKRKVMRVGARVLPLLLLYTAIGWRSGNPIFVPIQALQAVTDPKIDASAEWRDHENFNLVQTIVHHPFLGSGFGHEYAEWWPLPDISLAFPQYKYKPHNSVLGLLNSAGLLGFAGFWTILVGGVFLAARSYHRARRPDDRAAALSAIGIVLVYLIQGYGDLGFSAWNGVFILGPALAIVAKLAVHTGAWPGKRLAPLRREQA